MIASLPMYDRPELREETDALWMAMRDAIRERGADAPDSLDREAPHPDAWTDPALVLSQTCGLPWRLGLHQQAQLIGTPDYGVEDCPAGYYHSAVVVRKTDERQNVEAFMNGTCAFNADNSQSGYAAWEGRGFQRWLCTGSHGASIKAVAEGTADIAAVDAVTWRYAQRYDPEASELRVLHTTRPTPALPYITAQTRDGALLADAVTDAVATLDPAVKQTLGLVGFVRIPSETYLAV